jgi:glycosyltransferase 2 family protein
MIGADAQRPRIWFAVARWAAALIVLGLLLYFLPWKPLRAAIARVPVQSFLLVLGGYLMAHAVGVLKWRMVVNAAGAELDLATSAQCYAGGLFGTLFLPSIVGGDVVRLAVGLRRSPRPAAVLAGNIVDRMIDVAAQAGLVALGLVLLPEMDLVPDELEDRVEFTVMAFLCLVAAAGLLAYLFRKRLMGGRSVKFRRRLARLRHAIRMVSKRSHVLLLGWLLGTGIQMAFLLLTARLAIFCGLNLPLRAWLFAWPLAKLAAVLPLTQGGIGVREAALVGLLAPFGAPGYLVFAVGLVWEGVIIAGGLVAGAAALVLHRRASSVLTHSR